MMDGNEMYGRNTFSGRYS